MLIPWLFSFKKVCESAVFRIQNVGGIHNGKRSIRRVGLFPTHIAFSHDEYTEIDAHGNDALPTAFPGGITANQFRFSRPTVSRFPRIPSGQKSFAKRKRYFFAAPAALSDSFHSLPSSRPVAVRYNLRRSPSVRFVEHSRQILSIGENISS